MVQVGLRQWNVAIASKPQTPCFSHFLAPSSEWYYSVTSHCKAPSRCPLWHLQPYRLSELWKAQAEPVLCMGERNAEWDTDLGEALKTSGHLGGGRGEEWKLDLIFMANSKNMLPSLDFLSLGSCTHKCSVKYWELKLSFFPFFFFSTR